MPRVLSKNAIVTSLPVDEGTPFFFILYRFMRNAFLGQAK